MRFMVNTFKRANKFSDRFTVAQAAVEWQGLSAEQQELVTVSDGIPFLVGVPELTERAEAIADAAERKKIFGFTHNEDGDALPVQTIVLDRESARVWMKKIQAQLPPELPSSRAATEHQEPVEQLLTQSEVLETLRISRSTLFRRIKENKLSKAHFENPARWRKSYVISVIEADDGSEEI